ncbi:MULTISPECIES: M3 family metallopeptidase [unclassified Massilia]|uniref:M3 family metallopeptidase n=1 Tax=unclassified Massilia TaxID=2609279 RepID=UPI001B837132|nr:MULTISPECIES: M3 family metallopeptidase [unclassified Massilia]MBQ5940966.1 M3 family metallopeptidase [Massilia sp. AB1]MBQ5963756.1 M3 family metallopeptidase [Massilia sp. ZL223]
MNRPHILLVAAAAAGAAALAPAWAAPASQLEASNPFAKESSLPFNYPAWDKIRNEHFAPAFAEGMRVEALEVEAIANNKAAPTFENTIVAMERSGRLLDRVSAAFGTLSGSYTNDSIIALSKELAPKLAAHGDAIRLNPKLYQRIKTLYDKRNSLKLDAESKYLLERYHTDFVRAGAKLSDADKVKLKDYNAQLAALQTQFAQFTLKEANASALVVDTREELAGLSDKAIDAAALEAKKRGLDGKFVIPVVNTTQQAGLSVLTNRATREKLLAASLARGNRGGEFDTRDTVLKIAKLRAERAVLLGYPNHAAYNLEDQTAKNTKAVNSLLAEFAKPAVNNARKEALEIQKVIDAEKGGFQAAAQDWGFYSDKVRAQRYAFDASQLKPYFELNRVLQDGVFFAANKEFGISFKERKDLPTYNEDVRVFDVFDHDGKQLAIFTFDPYARSNKRGGAWANAWVGQSHLLGTKPVIANNLNVAKPAAGEPTLLTYDEVRTTFHEFGHALHGMFSDVKYPRFSGSRVPRDYVEFPSQVNEMWMAWPEVLSNYARHYQTGEPMPKELLDKVQASQQFNEGFRTTEYLAASLLDQAWHQLSPDQIPTDVLAFEAEALKKAGVDFALVPPRYRSTYFSHTFSGGYSAGYYGYLWAEKLDADTVNWFKENGGLTRKNGDHFRKTLLSRGGTIDAMQMYRNFSGRDAKVEPLLERRGLTAK